MKNIITALFTIAIRLFFLAGLLWGFFSILGGFSSNTKPAQLNVGVMKPMYTRPAVAPNGQSWPKTAGYINGYHRLFTDGLSSVTVDNSRNDSDVFVKLVSLSGSNAYPVRHIFIPAYSSFKLNKVTAGSYDIRYRNLANGRLSRSEPFNLEEIPTQDGIHYSNFTITIYKVLNGNSRSYDISEDEF